MEEKDKTNKIVDIMSVDIKTMKEVLIQNIEHITKEDIVDFSVVWAKSENSNTYKKIITIDIEKGGETNEQKEL